MFNIDFNTLSIEEVSALAQQKLLEVNEDWEANIWQFIAGWLDPNIPSIKIYSSGSTGAPKQIEHKREAVLASARLTCDALDLEEGDHALLCLPANKIGGMMMIVRSLYCKMNLHCMKPSSKPLSEIDESQVDFAAFTPMQFNEILKNDKAFIKAGKIDKIILGGEDVRPELLQKIQEMKCAVYITFGMTETISHIALKRLNGAHPDVYYRTLPGIEVDMEQGNLIIEAPQLGQPILVTNDAVNIISENEFEWLGRTDNVVNSGGVKIHPELIEKELAPVISKPFFIGGIPDKETGERLVLLIEIKDELPQVELAAILNAFQQLEKLHRPKEIRLLPSFTRTLTNKIIRKETLASNRFISAG